MIGVELWTRVEIFVKSWRRKCEDSFAYVSYSSKASVNMLGDMDIGQLVQLTIDIHVDRLVVTP